jgi:hypothetical protein
LTELVNTAVTLIAVIALFFATLRYGAERVSAVRIGEAQQAQLREALQHKDDFVAVVAIAGRANLLSAVANNVYPCLKN